MFWEGYYCEDLLELKMMSSKMSPWRRRGCYALGAAGVGAMAFMSASSFHDSLSSVARGSIRSSRAFYTFAMNSYDYKHSLSKHEYKSDDYYQARSQVHDRSAKRILRLCEQNKGFYIKAGQFVASMQYVPKEYTSVLSSLQDKATPCPFDGIKKIIVENFGKDVHEIYKMFEETPIASASVAQVHHAKLANGKEVAVKVQYPGLEKQLSVDINTMAFLSKSISWLFPDYEFGWLVPEFQKTLSKELDFLQEAENAERTAKLFKRKAVKVPFIFWELTTRQVLTMEFVQGCKIDDLQCLLAAGICPKEVARSLVETFAEMIFVHGHVHGDPHPGNILVSRNSNKQSGFRIVLLDHGIYRDLDEGFRKDFCHLWKTLILLDHHEMQQIGKRLGAGKYYRYLPVIFTGRTIDSKTGLGKSMTADDKKCLSQEVRQLTMGDVSQFMENLSRDLLVVLRTDGLLRAIISKLGASPRVRLFANMKYAIIGLMKNDKAETSLNYMSNIKATVFQWYMRLFVELLEFYYKFMTLSVSLDKQLRYWLKKLLGYFPGFSSVTKSVI